MLGELLDSEDERVRATAAYVVGLDGSERAQAQDVRAIKDPGPLVQRRGAEAVRRTVQGCLEIGIKYLTLYAFSSENWKRPQAEVDDLMALLRVYLRREIADLHKKGVEVRFIGHRERLAADIGKFFAEEFDRVLSEFQAERLIDFLVLKLGAPVYNQAIQDSRQYLQSKPDELAGEVYEPE